MKNYVSMLSDVLISDGFFVNFGELEVTFELMAEINIT